MRKIFQRVKSIPVYYSIPISVIIIFGIPLYFNITINPTEYSREWLIHYRFEDEDYLYIVDGRDIYDNLRYSVVKINDTIELDRSGIMEYLNYEPFGKDLEPDHGKEDDMGMHMDYYLEMKRQLKKEIPPSNIYDFIGDD